MRSRTRRSSPSCTAPHEEGAKIDIVARSICSLRPGVSGLSESISVRSVVGRFLEHSRLFIFQAGKKVSYFMGSPDLMPRNLDHRLEIVAPVQDPELQQRLRSFFDVLLAATRRPGNSRATGTGSGCSRRRTGRPAALQS